MLAVCETREEEGASRRELDRDTLARCIEGDASALQAFVLQYQSAVFALLSRLLGRGPHVEDLAQETFLRAFRALPRFDLDGPARPSTWLLTIGTRLAIDARRRSRVAGEHPSADPSEASFTHQRLRNLNTPERHSMQSELRTALQQATNALPVEQRDVFVLSEFHGLSLAEIGSTLGVRPATVKTRLHRARKKLMKALSAHYDECVPLSPHWEGASE